MSSVNEMTAVEFKIFENRLRRAAKRQHLELVKTRRRDRRAWDFGTYLILDPFTETIVAHSLSIDEAAEHLRDR